MAANPVGAGQGGIQHAVAAIRQTAQAEQVAAVAVTQAVQQAAQQANQQAAQQGAQDSGASQSEGEGRGDHVDVEA